MKTGGEVELGLDELEQLYPNWPRKASVPISHDGPRQAPILHHMLEE